MNVLSLLYKVIEKKSPNAIILNYKRVDGGYKVTLEDQAWDIDGDGGFVYDEFISDKEVEEVKDE